MIEDNEGWMITFGTKYFMDKNKQCYIYKHPQYDVLYILDDFSIVSSSEWDDNHRYNTEHAYYPTKEKAEEHLKEYLFRNKIKYECTEVSFDGTEFSAVLKPKTEERCAETDPYGGCLISSVTIPFWRMLYVSMLLRILIAVLEKNFASIYTRTQTQKYGNKSLTTVSYGIRL